jgi:hypothetical protein
MLSRSTTDDERINKLPHKMPTIMLGIFLRNVSCDGKLVVGGVIAWMVTAFINLNREVSLF